TILAETPRRITALTAGLAPAQLQTAPDPDEWSANDLLAHLRACADVWGNNLLAILAEDTPTLVGVDPRGYMRQTNYPQLRFRPSLRAFAAQRAELLAVLEPLSSAGWSRTAIVMAWGTPYRR